MGNNKFKIFMGIIITITIILTIVLISRKSQKNTESVEEPIQKEEVAVKEGEGAGEGAGTGEVKEKLPAENAVEEETMIIGSNYNLNEPLKSSGNAKIARIDEDGNIIIKNSDLSTGKVTFIRYSEESNIELVAVNDGAGNIKVAFNVSASHPEAEMGYFIQKDNELVCQECESKIALNEIGNETDDCRPMTINDEAITKTEDGIKINGSTLAVNKALFHNIRKH